MANNEKIQVYKDHRPHRNSIDNSIAQAFYSPDSSARQIELAQPEPAYYPEPQYQPEPQYHPERREQARPPAPKIKKRRKIKPEFDVDIQARHRHNFLAYTLVFAFFGALALILALNARFEYDRVALESERTHLATLLSGNAARASEIYATLDLEAIEAFAIEHLGMMPPEDFQMVEVVVTPQSFFSATHTEIPASDSFSLNRFWNVLFSFEADGQD